MQTVRALTAAFCLACIGAELTAQLVDAGWARQCIKALAGLYILVVLLRQLTGAAGTFSVPAAASAAPADLGSPEQLLLTQAETRLKDSLQQTIRQTWGTEAGLQIRLTSDGTAAQAQQVWVEFRPECPAEMQEQILNFLEQELGTRPERQEEA